MKTRIHTILIGLTLVITTILTLFLTYYLVEVDRKSAITKLHSTIERNNELLRLVNQTPLYNLDKKSLEFNLRSFFEDQNMIKITLDEFEGDIHIALSRPPLSTNGELIESKVAIRDPAILLGHITTTYSTAQIEQQLISSRNKHFAFSTVLLFSFFVIIYFSTKFLTSPIERLTRAAKKMAEGNLDVNLETKGVYELSTLGRSLHFMRNSVKEKIADLAQKNKVLEQEITTRKKTEKENEYLKNLLQNTFDSMPSILVGVNQLGTITQWNKQAASITGKTNRQAIGNQVNDLLPNPIQPDSIQDAITNKKIVKLGKQAIASTNQIVDITIYPLREGNVREAVIRIDDITERVQKDEMLIQSEKLASLGNLAAGMAHEINNPLAGIIQNIQVIVNRTNTSLKKNRETAEKMGIDITALHNYLEERSILSMAQAIMDSSLRAATIVENMLGFSRKDNSGSTTTNMISLVDQTIEFAANDYNLDNQFDFRKIKIVRQYDQNLPQIHCEKTKIQQVLLNLFQNGAHAMDAAGQPAPCFTIKLYQSSTTDITVEVTDNGAGMNEDKLKRIFEPFFTTKEPGEGTGLGLSVSYFIITEDHGGTMQVTSTPDKGSTFSFTLPIKGKFNPLEKQSIKQ